MPFVLFLLGFLVLYLLAVCTPIGQRIENAVLSSEDGSKPAWIHEFSGAYSATGPTLPPLGELALPTAAVGLLVLVLLTLVRRCWWQGAAAVCVAGAAIGAAEVLGQVLPRPDLVNAPVYFVEPSFPSGHAAVASALEKGKDSVRSRPRALRVMGTLQRRQHRLRRAEEVLREALVAVRRIDDRPEQARVLRELALVLALGPAPEAGVEVIDQAKRLCEQTGESGRRARPGVWFAWGCVLAACQRWEEADQVLRDAGALAADLELGQQLWVPWIWYQRAVVAYQRGHYERCREQALSALEGFTDFQHRYGAAHCRLLIGRAYLAESEVDRATPFLEEAHRTLRRCGDRWIEADAAVELAEAYLSHRRGREAVDLLTQAEQAFAKLGDSDNRERAARLLWEVESELPPETPPHPPALDLSSLRARAGEVLARLVGDRRRG